MTASKLDPNTPNNDIGLYIRKSRRVVVGTPFGEPATWIKAGAAGVVVYQYGDNGDPQIWELETGEVGPLFCDRILTSATIDGNLETTSASGMIWGSCPGSIGEER